MKSGLHTSLSGSRRPTRPGARREPRRAGLAGEGVPGPVPGGHDDRLPDQRRVVRGRRRARGRRRRQGHDHDAPHGEGARIRRGLHHGGRRGGAAAAPDECQRAGVAWRRSDDCFTSASPVPASDSISRSRRRVPRTVTSRSRCRKARFLSEVPGELIDWRDSGGGAWRQLAADRWPFDSVRPRRDQSGARQQVPERAKRAESRAHQDRMEVARRCDPRQRRPQARGRRPGPT